jgi:dolichol kinase
MESFQAAPRAAQAEDLEALVARTEGLQPGRRLFHAAWGVTFAMALHLWEPERWIAAGVLGALSLILLIGDLIRLRVPALNRLFFRAFRSFASPREAAKPASSTWYVVGCALSVALFPRDIAVAAILVLALADPAASYFGRRWGTRAWGTGSVEGSALFFLVALVVLLLFMPPIPAVAAALVVMWVERTRWPVDDNLSIPLATGAVLWALLAVLG